MNQIFQLCNALLRHCPRSPHFGRSRRHAALASPRHSSTLQCPLVQGSPTDAIYSYDGIKRTDKLLKHCLRDLSPGGRALHRVPVERDQARNGTTDVQTRVLQGNQTSLGVDERHVLALHGTLDGHRVSSHAAACPSAPLDAH